MPFTPPMEARSPIAPQSQTRAPTASIPTRAAVFLIARLEHTSLAVVIVLVNLPFLILGFRVIGKIFAIKAVLSIIGLAIVVAFFPFPEGPAWPVSPPIAHPSTPGRDLSKHSQPGSWSPQRFGHEGGEREEIKCISQFAAVA